MSKKVRKSKKSHGRGLRLPAWLVALSPSATARALTGLGRKRR
jgi:hypothetical protein